MHYLLQTKVDDTMQNLSNIRAKNRGLGIPQLRSTAETQYKTSKIATEHLTKTLVGREELCSTTHYRTGSKARKNNNLRTKELEKLRFQKAVKGLPNTKKRILKRAPHTGIWQQK